MPKLKVLYFISSSKPTNHERQAAFYTGQAVAFRNVTFVKPNDIAEPCDAVMGVPIPSQYADIPVFTK
jgi:hypothetical protein